MTLSQHQFREILPEPYFHGTTPEAAEEISQHGFSTATQRNGSSAGRGVYLHDQDRQTRQYGPVTVAAEVPDHVEIHPNPYADHEIVSRASELASTRGGELHDHITTALQEQGYGGHRDPDDRATIIHDPKNVEYLTHYNYDEAYPR